MRSLDIKYIKKVLNENQLKLYDFKTFIETGTYLGETVFSNSIYFDNLYTVEINKKAYERCKKEAVKKNIKNIKFFLGDSALMLKSMIKIAGEKSKIYFLDGHVTDNKSGFTGKGIVDVPLLAELKQISILDNSNSLIIIDDTRLLGQKRSTETANGDWSQININAILDSINKNRIKKWYFTEGARNQKNDRLIILLN